MAVVDAVQLLLIFGTKGGEVVGPSPLHTKIGIGRVEAELQTVVEAIHHRVEHIHILCEKAGIHAEMVDQSILEGFVDGIVVAS
jgi:hypothetical protein